MLPRTSPPRTLPPQRSRSVAALAVALTLALAGCASEDAQQEAAREEVQAHIRALPTASRYDVDDVHCTDAARTFLREEETNEFTCAARVVEGGCDWFEVRVDRERGRVRVALEERDAGCTLGL